ncbi:MAG: hypothetical protein EAZ85_13865, partial [Bacteroidetes bacterium]
VIILVSTSHSAILIPLASQAVSMRLLHIGQLPYTLKVTFSVFVLRGTFGSQYFDSNEIRFFELDTWNYPYLLSWILSIMFPLIVGYLSHKVKLMIDLEEMAKDKLRESDPEKYKELFGNF